MFEMYMYIFVRKECTNESLDVEGSLLPTTGQTCVLQRIGGLRQHISKQNAKKE